MVDPAPTRRRLVWTMEGANVLGVIGASCVVFGACAFDWALGLIAVSGCLRRASKATRAWPLLPFVAIGGSASRRFAKAAPLRSLGTTRNAGGH